MVRVSRFQKRINYPDKAAILKRVAETAGATEAQKTKETADIKEYWKQYWHVAPRPVLLRPGVAQRI